MQTNPPDCPYYDHEISSCNIITTLAEIYQYTPSQETCRACGLCVSPKNVNSITIAVADSVRKEEGLSPLNTTSGGPGSILSSWLEWFVTADPDCDCESRAKIMDAWGPEGCKRNINLIIHWLRSSAQIKGIPFSSFVAEQLVNLACHMATKNPQKH